MAEPDKLRRSIIRPNAVTASPSDAADGQRTRGEFVVVIHPAQQEVAQADGGLRVLKLLLAEVPLKTAAKLAAEITGGSKNELYQVALALKEVSKVLDFIRSIKAGGRSCIYIEHNIHHVHEVCDRLVVLDRGEVALDTPASALTYLELTDFLMSLHKRRITATN